MVPNDPEAALSAKIDFVERQAELAYEFVLESRDILVREAHTTLNWLYGIAVGGSGYLLTLLNAAQPSWWLIAALAAAVGTALICVAILIRRVMMADIVFPRGNDPKNLFDPDFFEQDLTAIRRGTVEIMQERIDLVRVANHRRGKVINGVRQTIVLIPLIATAAAALCQALILF